MLVRNRYADDVGNIKQNSVVNFVWRVEVGGFEGEQQVQIRFDSACARGVPAPDNWKAAARCLGLSARSTAAADRVREEIVVEKVECKLLGRPKHVPLRDPSIDRVPGALVHLAHGERRQHFLLVAHIEETKWFCHCGGDGPLKFELLCVKDIVRDISLDRRRRKSVKTSNLRTMVLSNMEQ